MLEYDIRCGAPVLKANGELDIYRYGAWLARENCDQSKVRHR
jgi:hypothetical protein